MHPRRAGTCTKVWAARTLTSREPSRRAERAETSSWACCGACLQAAGARGALCRNGFSQAAICPRSPCMALAGLGSPFRASPRPACRSSSRDGPPPHLPPAPLLPQCVEPHADRQDARCAAGGAAPKPQLEEGCAGTESAHARAAPAVLPGAHRVLPCVALGGRGALAGGRLVYQYVKKATAHPTCPVSGAKLNGVRGGAWPGDDRRAPRAKAQPRGRPSLQRRSGRCFSVSGSMTSSSPWARADLFARRGPVRARSCPSAGPRS